MFYIYVIVIVKRGEKEVKKENIFDRRSKLIYFSYFLGIFNFLFVLITLVFSILSIIASGLAPTGTGIEEIFLIVAGNISIIFLSKRILKNTLTGFRKRDANTVINTSYLYIIYGIIMFFILSWITSNRLIALYLVCCFTILPIILNILGGLAQKNINIKR